jgi:TfoX N-terminal domain
MAYDQQLAHRIRQVFGSRRDIAERRMFGGLCFLFRGRLCCGIVGSDLMVQVSRDECEAIVRKPHVRPWDFTGKPFKGIVHVPRRGSGHGLPFGHGCLAVSGSLKRRRARSDCARGHPQWPPRV